MNRNKIIKTQVVLFFLCVFPFEKYCNAEKIKVITEHLPPFQIAKNEQIVGGLLVEVMYAVLKTAKINSIIEVYPWSRAYDMALHNKNVIIFSMMRIKEREPLFKWIGKLYTLRHFFWSLKSRKDITINSLNDAKKYEIGVVKDSYPTIYLKRQGFTEAHNLHIGIKNIDIWRMLFIGRIDAILSDEIITKGLIKNLGFNYQKLKKNYEIKKRMGNDLYVAASMATSDVIVFKLEKAIKKIKSNGTYESILRKWR